MDSHVLMFEQVVTDLDVFPDKTRRPAALEQTSVVPNVWPVNVCP